MSAETTKVEMMRTATRVLAIPSLSQDGLDAQRSGHFGHAEYHTLVYLAGDEMIGVDIMDNPPHSEGGCLEPVVRLVERGVTDMVVGGMGLRPLNGLLSAGVRVYVMPEQGTVREGLEAVLNQTAPMMSPAHACGGQGGCAH